MGAVMQSSFFLLFFIALAGFVGMLEEKLLPVESSPLRDLSPPPFCEDTTTVDVKLVVKKGPTTTRTVQLQAEETFIGRHSDCSLRIPSAEVSRRHCLLSFHDGYLSVEDLDSVNGTFLNGERVTGKQPVRPGDLLGIGPVTFAVQYEAEPGALPEANNLLTAFEEGEELVDAAIIEEEDFSVPMEVALVEGTGGDEEPMEVALIEADGDEPIEAALIEETDLETLQFEPAKAKKAASAKAEDEPLPLANDADELVEVELDEAEEGSWKMPEGNDFHDILSKMDR